MIRLRFLSPFKSNNNLLFKQASVYKFSSDNKPSENKFQNNKQSQTPTQETLSEQFADKSENEPKVTQKTSFIYNQQQDQQDPNNSFLKRLERMEQGRGGSGGKGRSRIDGLIFPALLCLTSAFLYHCWQTQPYNTIYK